MKSKLFLAAMLVASLLASGCVGTSIQVRGFTPNVTNMILKTHEAAVEKACTKGVAGSARDGVIVTNQPDDPYRYYPATQRTEVHATVAYRCN